MKKVRKSFVAIYFDGGYIHGNIGDCFLGSDEIYVSPNKNTTYFRMKYEFINSIEYNTNIYTEEPFMADEYISRVLWVKPDA